MVQTKVDDAGKQSFKIGNMNTELFLKEILWHL